MEGAFDVGYSVNMGGQGGQGTWYPQGRATASHKSACHFLGNWLRMLTAKQPSLPPSPAASHPLPFPSLLLQQRLPGPGRQNPRASALLLALEPSPVRLSIF